MNLLITRAPKFSSVAITFPLMLFPRVVTQFRHVPGDMVEFLLAIVAALPTEHKQDTRFSGWALIGNYFCAHLIASCEFPARKIMQE